MVPIRYNLNREVKPLSKLAPGGSHPARVFNHTDAASTSCAYFPMSSLDAERTPLRLDQSREDSPSDEMLGCRDEAGKPGQKQWPLVMLGVFIGVMLTVLQTGDVGTCTPALSIMLGFLPGMAAGCALTKFWLGGNAGAIFASAETLLRNAQTAVMQTPVAQGFLRARNASDDSV